MPGFVTLLCSCSVVGSVQLMRKPEGCSSARSLKLNGTLTVLKPREMMRCTWVWKSWLKLLALSSRPSNIVLPLSNPGQVTPMRLTATPWSPMMVALTVVKPVVVEAVVARAAAAPNCNISHGGKQHLQIYCKLK